MMIFITIIQPKIFRSVFTSKYFLSGRNSKKQLHVFFLLIDLRSTGTSFSFNRFQKQFLISFQKQPTFFKKHGNVSRSSHTIFNIKKIYSEAAVYFSFRSSRFRGSCTKHTHFVLKVFHNLSMIMKNIFDGY